MKGIGLYRRNGAESGGSERFLNKKLRRTRTEQQQQQKNEESNAIG